jgi:hypothetical protein
MTLLDDICDGCGARFDPMGDPELTKRPEIGPYAVFCAVCQGRAAGRDEHLLAEDAFWREQEAGATKRDRGGYYHDGFVDGFKAALASDAVARIKAEARAEADAVRDRKFGNLRWMDGHQQGVRDGRAEVVAAVEGVLRDGPDAWTPYASRDTGLTFLVESVLDFTADLRAALAAVEEGER